MQAVLTPVYIVLLLVVLKLVIGEERLPAVPKLPAAGPGRYKVRLTIKHNVVTNIDTLSSPSFLELKGIL